MLSLKSNSQIMMTGKTEASHTDKSGAVEVLIKTVNTHKFMTLQKE